MKNMINTLLVLGNGFDIALSMNTSYKTFFEELNQKRGFFEQNSLNPLINYIQKVGTKENWYDFESIIKEFATRSDLGVNLRRCEMLISVLNKSKLICENAYDQIITFKKLSEVIPSLNALLSFVQNHQYYEFQGPEVEEMWRKVKDDTKAFIDSQSMLIFEGFKKLKQELTKFSLSKSRPIGYSRSPAYSIIEAILGHPRSPHQTAQESVSNLSANNLVIPPHNQVVSFNYMNEFDILGIYLQFSEKVQRRLGFDEYLDTPFFLNIHNHLDFSDIQNYDAEIVFGSDDDEYIPNCLCFLMKSYWLHANDNISLFTEMLNNAKRIVIYGHSIHGIDYAYYRKFFSTQHDDKEIYVIVHKQTVIDEIKRSLIAKKCKSKIKYLIVGEIPDKEYSKLCRDIIDDTDIPSQG